MSVKHNRLDALIHLACGVTEPLQSRRMTHHTSVEDLILDWNVLTGQMKLRASWRLKMLPILVQTISIWHPFSKDYSAYEYTIVFRKTEKHQSADALSRLPRNQVPLQNWSYCQIIFEMPPLLHTTFASGPVVILLYHRYCLLSPMAGRIVVNLLCQLIVWREQNSHCIKVVWCGDPAL